MIRWTSVEYRKVPRSNDWYWGLSLGGIVLAGLAASLNNILFAIVILIGTGMIFYYSLRTPPAIEVEITEQGVRVGSELFLVENLSSFSIEGATLPRAIIRTRGALGTPLVLPLGDTDQDAVRGALMALIPEQAWSPSLVEAISEYLGF